MSDLKELRQSLNTLIAQRELLEVEADAIHSELTSPGPNGEPPAGIKDPLVDAEDFPRNDIDIYNVKRKRLRLSGINFEHKEMMKQIEALVHQMHSLESDSATPSQVEGAINNNQAKQAGPGTVFTTAEVLLQRPIAKLDEILEGSPAAEAGIHDGDFLMKFGNITSVAADALPSIAKLVGVSVSKPIAIIVKRGEEVRRRQNLLLEHSFDHQCVVGTSK
ncbi:hypothetical protein EON65_51320 [archaeon]|nr:MAG: hypothetical protein EON65_51320 [archaeon]